MRVLSVRPPSLSPAAHARCSFARARYLESTWKHGTSKGLAAAMVRTSFLKSVRHMQDLSALTKGVRVFHVAEPHTATEAADDEATGEAGAAEAYTPPDAPHTKVGYALCGVRVQAWAWAVVRHQLTRTREVPARLQVPDCVHCTAGTPSAKCPHYPSSWATWPVGTFKLETHKNKCVALPAGLAGQAHTLTMCARLLAQVHYRHRHEAVVVVRDDNPGGVDS